MLTLNFFNPQNPGVRVFETLNQKYYMNESIIFLWFALEFFFNKFFFGHIKKFLDLKICPSKIVYVYGVLWQVSNNVMLLLPAF